MEPVEIEELPATPSLVLQTNEMGVVGISEHVVATFGCHVTNLCTALGQCLEHHNCQVKTNLGTSRA